MEQYLSVDYLNQFTLLTERDILVTAKYLSNTWIAGKFLELIPLLDAGISENKDEVRNMDDDNFKMSIGSIIQPVNQMQGFLYNIQKEEKTE